MKYVDSFAELGTFIYSLSRVMCYNYSGHVTALRLPTPLPDESCLEGVIPHEIGNLSKLTYLNLNIQYDPYSMRVQKLRWLSQLTLLKELDLGGIDLSLTTNNWLSIVNKLPQLQVLRLDSCKLSLNLPSSLSYINSSTTLDTITLSGNNLNDTSIFEWLSNLSGFETSLVYLDLSENSQLFGSNYQHIQNFFSKSYNYLTPISDLSDNQLWGSIPDKIGNLSYLRVLYINDNQLNGSISQAVGRLSMLEILDLSSNSLKGVFTNIIHLSNLSKLSYLGLRYNRELVVNISVNWVPPFQLQRLFLSSCKVGPDFPMWLITQKTLTSIDMSNASISGKIPDSFFKSLSSKLGHY
ncbi:receptor-like protein EIX1 [Silene latifolia]|uniref:receptor-like protein EIX1 n=1 Tax=Silene latifolia TaxID=37657 RepID=UPI003D76D937